MTSNVALCWNQVANPGDESFPTSEDPTPAGFFRACCFSLEFPQHGFFRTHFEAKLLYPSDIFRYFISYILLFLCTLILIHNLNQFGDPISACWRDDDILGLPTGRAPNGDPTPRFQGA